MGIQYCDHIDFLVVYDEDAFICPVCSLEEEIKELETELIELQESG